MPDDTEKKSGLRKLFPEPEFPADGRPGMLIGGGPGGRPVTTQTKKLLEVLEHVMTGGKAFLNLDVDHGGYEIYDFGLKQWIKYSANAFTMSQDHVQDLRMEDETLVFDGFFHERMVTPGAAISVVRTITEHEADERNRRSMFGDVVPGNVVRVKMRIKSEDFDFAFLEIGRMGVGTYSDRRPHRREVRVRRHTRRTT